jgi:hypothetical protein
MIQARLLIRNHYTSIVIIEIFVCAKTNFSPSHLILPNSLLHVAATHVSDKMAEEAFIAGLI